MGEQDYLRTARTKITVCLAISANGGLVFHTAFLGGMNRERFADYLTQTHPNLDPDEGVILIYDGTPASYVTVAMLDDIDKGSNIIQYLFWIPWEWLRKLPPYSPLLNIVEQAISVLKAGIKADIFRTEIQRLMGDRDAARNRRLSFGEFRTHLLDALHAAKYRYNNCSEFREIWYRFMQTYIPRCLNGVAIPGWRIYDISCLISHIFCCVYLKRYLC